MNALPEHTLPLATTSPFTRWGHASLPAPGNWSKALDHAQSAGTGAFALQGEGRGRNPASHEVPPGHPGPLRAVQATSLAARVGTQAIDSGKECPGDADRGWMGALQPVCAAAASHADPNDPSLEQVEQCGSRGHPPTRAAPERPSLRVHVEQHADGAAVWLGVPATFNARSAASVCAALRQLALGGLPLARLTCNGRSVYDRVDTFQENP